MPAKASKTALLILATLAMASMTALSVANAQEKKTPIPARLNFGYAAAASPTKPAPIGFYTRGCLAGGEQLPHTGPAWQAMRLSRNRNWGHPDMIQFLKTFAKDTQKLGWPGLLIGDISQPRGGPMMSGHRSHQVGLDADIWYMPMPKRQLTWREREDMSAIPLAGARSIKTNNNWRPKYLDVLRHAAKNPKVQRILTHPAVKKKLCESETGDKKWLSKIRPVFGHNYHFHVRLFCPPGSKGCRAQKSVPSNHGCGKHLDYWINLFTKPQKKKKQVAKPRKPRKPAPVRTIDWLPKSCRHVLTVDRPQLVAYSVAPARAILVEPRRNPKRR